MGGKVEKPKVIEDIQKEADKQLKGVQKSVETELTGLTETLKTEAKGFKDTVETELKGAGINTEQDLSPNIQTLTPNLDQRLNIPSLNLEQDLTRISLPGLQKELLNITTAGQAALSTAGAAGQAALVQAGKAAQEQAVRAGAAMQENAVQFGKAISDGQSNPTLEGYADQLTKGTEELIDNATQYVEEKVIPAVGDAYATAYGDKNPVILTAQGLVKAGELLTPKIEQLGMILNPGKTEGTTPQEISGDNLASAPTIGDPDELPMEQATTKADQMSEEERLRRIRRLLLNRYGREDTILSGVGDTRSRRRYAL